MSTRVAGLDLVRAIAIVFVVLSHGLPILYPHAGWLGYLGHLGSAGVDLFFVLSGFLIGGILWRMGAQLGSMRGLGGFWIRRWLRTLPNYFFFLALTAALGAWLYERPFAWRGEVLPTMLFVQNLTGPGTPFFPESWTLAIEEWFYLITPLLLLLGLRMTRRFAMAWWLAVLLMLVVPLFIRAIPPLPPLWDPHTRMPVMHRLDALAYGVAAAALAARFPAAWRRWRGPCALLGFGLAAAGYVGLYQLDLDHSYFAHTLLFNLFSVGYALMLPLASATASLGGGKFERGVHTLALWSYSLYLCNFGLHTYIVRKLSPYFHDSLGYALAIFAGYWLAALMIAAAAYHGVEQPFLRLRERLRLSRESRVAAVPPVAERTVVVP